MLFEGYKSQTNLPAAEYRDDPTFGETFNASLGFFVDEEMSVSALFNRENFSERNKQIEQKFKSGELNRKRYLAGGSVDWDLAARESGLKTDEELNAERNKMLADRRAYAQDVMNRGSGLAQFLGMGVPVMLDPVGLLTLPLSGPAIAARGLTVLQRLARGAAFAGGISAAEEAVIQPFVFNHKATIDSPYDITDAIANIGAAAAFGGALGGAVGGVAGMLRAQQDNMVASIFGKLDEADAKVLDFVRGLKSGEIDSEVLRKAGVDADDVITAYESMGRLADDLEADRATRAVSNELIDAYHKVQAGEYSSFMDAAKASIKSLEKERAEVVKAADTVKRYAAKNGGLDREAWLAEGVDAAEFKQKSEVFGKPTFPKKGGMTPDDLAERLVEDGFLDVADANKAIDLVFENKVLDGEKQAKLDQIDNDLGMLQQGADEEYLASVYRGAVENDVAQDVKFLELLEQKRGEIMESFTGYEDYIELESKPEVRSQASGVRESDALNQSGLADDYNADIQAMKALPEPVSVKLDADGNFELLDARKIDEDLEAQLQALETVQACVYGK